MQNIAVPVYVRIKPNEEMSLQNNKGSIIGYFITIGLGSNPTKNHILR